MKTPKPTVLYLDDLKEQLTNFSANFFDVYKIYTANTTIEAREILKQYPIEVILADYSLVEAGEITNGVDFFESIMPLYPHPIRMLITGQGDKEVAVNAINKGRVFRYIEKPVNDEELKMIIDGASALFRAEERYRQLLATLEDKVKERTARLMELNAEKNEFLGIVAHDLKNPLANIRMFAELIHRDGETLSKEEVKEYTGDILAEADRMFTLITNLLDVNKIERGFKVHPVELDIAGIVQAVVENYRQRAEQKRLHLHFEQSSPNTLVMADEVATMQIVENLISNAVKYSPNGKDKNIWVRVLQAQKAVRVEVQDEGPGLSAEDKEKLFKHFARLSAQPTGGEHSTGLGLSIVKKMVEAMNGKIWVESEQGKGATFIVELLAA
ncbi:MAG: hybrid sensor histidine kinase/response regulator [Bacteroidota bacterium]|nr:hybrid sensor histidine kinase/response regulator [Candidatus Kapabacteria bacterium]MDW8220021.1 hybrid sensor histidine kinase/response regulator [Bacteroidota bacterium]